MGNKVNADMIQDDKQKFITLYNAFEIIYQKADINVGKEEFYNTNKNKLKRKLSKLLGEGADTYLKKPNGKESYTIPVKGVNCIAVLLNINLKEELGGDYGGEVHLVTLNESEEEDEEVSEREKYRSEIENLFQVNFESTSIAARLYLRSQLRMLFSGCSGEVQRKMAKAYNIKYFPNAKEASEKIEVLNAQIYKLLENWDADQGTFRTISESCNMGYRYIVAEVQMLMFKRLFTPDLQDAVATLQP